MVVFVGCMVLFYLGVMRLAGYMEFAIVMLCSPIITGVIAWKVTEEKPVSVPPTAPPTTPPPTATRVETTEEFDEEVATAQYANEWLSHKNNINRVDR